MQGVTGDDMSIFWEIFEERGMFRCFYGCLASNDSVLLGR